jgi:hypothetical protein
MKRMRTPMEGSRWFRRLIKDVTKMSPDVRIVKLKFGFYRIYYRQAYIHEVYKEMPEHGYDFEEYDLRFESQSYFEEYEDHETLVRTIKNYKEGYWDALDFVRTRVYLMRNDKEFHDKATKAYRQMVVK